ncbi:MULTISPECIES: hypothetical protein [unclassified Undibacterium]|nr:MULTISPECIES: hypothetical protein [unclassified Undibacterium]
MAQQDIRNMQVACAGQSTDEQLQEYRQRLVVETGTIVKMEAITPLDAKRDESGFAQLKALSNA